MPTKDKGHKNLNVPNLRVPEFQGEWEKKRLCQVLKIGNGKDYKHLAEGDIPVFGTGGYMVSVNDYLMDGETVCIGRKGTINRPFYYSGKFWTVDTLFYTHSYNNVIPKFVLYAFEHINWLKYNEASSVPSLSKNTIEQIDIDLPSISEQQKIAMFLSLIDERIATQNKIIEKLESLIIGLNNYLHKKYGNEIEISLAELGKSYKGLSGKSGDDFDGNGKPYITYVNVYQNNIINESMIGYVKISDGEKQNMISYGDALFTISSETPQEVGMAAVYLGDSKELYLNSFCFGYRLREFKVLNPQYMPHCFSSYPFRKFVYPLAQGSTRFNLHIHHFLNKKIKIPTFQNQLRITNTLTVFLAKIATEKQIRAAFIQQKTHFIKELIR
ncbi:MAG: restriction endonuclease subunit S [Tannerellaceae bacterium]|nr:restriction endonuclease subunit S [Tannerellaceae bacterium]